MIFRKPGAHPTSDGQAAETRAERRRRERYARRGVIPPKPLPEWKRRLEGGIWWLWRKSLYWITILVFGFVLYTANEKISDPRIVLWGKVLDEHRQPIKGAVIQWSTSRDGGFGRVYSGTRITNELGDFCVSRRSKRKTMRGTSVTIHRVSKEGYQDDNQPRTFRFYKDPSRIEGDSSNYVLRKRGGN